MVIQTADGIEIYLDSHRRRRFFCGRCGTSAMTLSMTVKTWFSYRFGG